MQRPSRAFAGVLSGLATGLATLLFATGTAARAERLELHEVASAPVELTAPLESAVLVGGSTAEVAWQPRADFAELAGAEEWEAFLSVDGGHTFAVRLTPHLDLAARRFVFRVPDLPSDAVRLLLRFGDERQERAVRLPLALRIVRAAVPAAVPASLWTERSVAPGEPALAGMPGVRSWVEGRRDGTALRTRAAAPPEARSESDPVLLAGGRGTLGADDAEGLRLGERAASVPHPEAAGAPSPVVARAEPLSPRDILLLLQRQNE